MVAVLFLHTDMVDVVALLLPKKLPGRSSDDFHEMASANSRSQVVF